jgi:hypothetical protein
MFNIAPFKSPDLSAFLELVAADRVHDIVPSDRLTAAGDRR